MKSQRKGEGESPASEKGVVRDDIPPQACAPRPFTLSLQEKPALPVLLSVPHAGRAYPPELCARMRQPALATLRLEDRFVDLLAEEVVRETGAALLVAHAPRALIDLNRTPDDMDWDMVAGGAPENAVRLAAGSRARSGLGLVPRRLPGMGELWQRRMTREEVETRLARVHQPYHAALAQALEQLRDCWGAALLIDLHSMPPLGCKNGADAAPDFVVGDRFGASCASYLSAAALQHFAEIGRGVAHNRPYAGGYVLDRHGAPARSVHAMQIEVCRSAYLDARLAEPGPGLPAVARVLAALVRRLAGELTAARGLAQAAE
jgi:N-formylglutamate amidohydrolase